MEKKYEGCFLLNPEISEEDMVHQVGVLEKILTDGSVNIIGKESLGNKTLAYPIKKRTQAFFYLIYFSALPDAINPIKEALNRNVNVLRYLIINKKEIPEKQESENGGTESE